MSVELTESKGSNATPTNVAISMDTVGGFEALQRIAIMFTKSEMVPPQYQEMILKEKQWVKNPNCIANATIAVDMAMRMGANPLMVMQNLYVVYGRPGWSATFLIGTFNKCGRFSSIQYEMQGDPNTMDFGCRAFCTEKGKSEKIYGPLVTLQIAKDEKWIERGGKWKNLPELMLRYRAATFLIRTIAPEIALGLQTAEEVEETIELQKTSDGTYTVNADVVELDKKSMNDNLKAKMWKKMGAEPEAEIPSLGEQPANTTPTSSADFESAYAKLSGVYNEREKEVDDLLGMNGISQSLIEINKDCTDEHIRRVIVAIAKDF